MTLVARRKFHIRQLRIGIWLRSCWREQQNVLQNHNEKKNYPKFTDDGWYTKSGWSRF